MTYYENFLVNFRATLNDIFNGRDPVGLGNNYGASSIPQIKKSLWDYDVKAVPGEKVHEENRTPEYAGKYIADFPLLPKKLMKEAENLRNRKCKNNEGFYLKDEDTLLFVGKHNSKKIIIELLDDQKYEHNTKNYAPIKCRSVVKNGIMVHHTEDFEVRKELINNLALYRYVIYLYNHAFYIKIALKKVREMYRDYGTSPIWETPFIGMCANCGCKKNARENTQKFLTIKCYKPSCGRVTKFCNSCSVKKDRTCCKLWFLVSQEYHKEQKSAAKKSDVEEFVDEVTRVFGSYRRENSYFYKLKMFIED